MLKSGVPEGDVPRRGRSAANEAAAGGWVVAYGEPPNLGHPDGLLHSSPRRSARAGPRVRLASGTWGWVEEPAELGIELHNGPGIQHIRHCGHGCHDIVDSMDFNARGGGSGKAVLPGHADQGSDEAPPGRRKQGGHSGGLPQGNFDGRVPCIAVLAQHAVSDLHLAGPALGSDHDHATRTHQHVIQTGQRPPGPVDVVQEEPAPRNQLTKLGRHELIAAKTRR